MSWWCGVVWWCWCSDVMSWWCGVVVLVEYCDVAWCGCVGGGM